MHSIHLFVALAQQHKDDPVLLCQLFCVPNQRTYTTSTNTRRDNTLLKTLLKSQEGDDLNME